MAIPLFWGGGVKCRRESSSLAWGGNTNGVKIYLRVQGFPEVDNLVPHPHFTAGETEAGEEWGACHQSLSSEAGPGLGAFGLPLYLQQELYRQGARRPSRTTLDPLWGRPLNCAGPRPLPSRPRPPHRPAGVLCNRPGLTSRTPRPLASGELRPRPSQAVPAPSPPSRCWPGGGLSGPAAQPGCWTASSGPPPGHTFADLPVAVKPPLELRSQLLSGTSWRPQGGRRGDTSRTSHGQSPNQKRSRLPLLQAQPCPHTGNLAGPPAAPSRHQVGCWPPSEGGAMP